MSNESHITVHNEGDVLVLEIQETRISEGRILEALSTRARSRPSGQGMQQSVA